MDRLHRFGDYEQRALRVAIDIIKNDKECAIIDEYFRGRVEYYVKMLHDLLDHASNQED